MRQDSTKFGRIRMDVKKFLETLCRLLSEQEGVNVNVTISPKEGDENALII